MKEKMNKQQIKQFHHVSTHLGIATYKDNVSKVTYELDEKKNQYRHDDGHPGDATTNTPAKFGAWKRLG
jgi:hypothetical protein